VTGLTNHLEAAQLEQPARRSAKCGVIIDHDRASTHVLMVTPRAAVDEGAGLVSVLRAGPEREATIGLRGRSSVGRASASQAEGRGFEPRRPLSRRFVGLAT